MNNTIKVMWQYYKMEHKRNMQFPAASLVNVIAVFVRESISILVIYLTLLRFDHINDWNMDEMFFLFSLLFLTYSGVVMLFADMRRFSAFVRDGKFDRIMVRPQGMMIQLISSNADGTAALGHGFLGLVLFVVSANNVGITWNAVNILYYVFTIIGGILIQGAVFVFFSALCFYFVEVQTVRDILYWNTRKFAGYPISIFNKGIQFIMIYMVPFAFVNYFPAQYLLRKPDMAAYPEIYMYIAPFLGIVLYILAYLFFRYSVRYYTSTGN